MKGRELLSSWLRENESSQAEFATLVGASTSAVSYWLSGRKRPGRRFARRIEAVTRQRVPIESWDGDEVDTWTNPVGASCEASACCLSASPT